MYRDLYSGPDQLSLSATVLLVPDEATGSNRIRSADAMENPRKSPTNQIGDAQIWDSTSGMPSLSNCPGHGEDKTCG